MDLSNAFSVKGKVVLITGGGKGIGSMIAEGFVGAGATVYITGREEKALQAKAQELSRLGATSGGKCFYIAADLQSVKGVERIVAELGSREKHLNVLVNNAGANWGADIEECTSDPSSWRLILVSLRIPLMT